MPQEDKERQEILDFIRESIGDKSEEEFLNEEPSFSDLRDKIKKSKETQKGNPIDKLFD